eukprot:SAG11_NODE_36572_length_260_cov_1793.130435_1_plen_67_part_01
MIYFTAYWLKSYTKLSENVFMCMAGTLLLEVCDTRKVMCPQYTHKHSGVWHKKSNVPAVHIKTLWDK